MKTKQVNLRLEARLIAMIEAAADAEHLDRGSMIRKLLLESLWDWRLKYALRRYQAGEISIGRACEDSGRSHWEMIDLIRQHGIVHPVDVEDSIARVRLVMRKWDERVAEAGPMYGATGASDSVASASLGHAPRGEARPSGGAPSRPGDPAPTLPDHPPRPGGILLVGVNPAPRSVERGHYYQGAVGQRIWRRLQAIGHLEDPLPGLEDEAFVRAGHGLTDLVKRVTKSAAEVGADELRAGAVRLRTLVGKWRPGVVVFAFKLAASTALADRRVRPGRCGEIAGVPAFLFTGPYASRAARQRNDDQLKKLLEDLDRQRPSD